MKLEVKRFEEVQQYSRDRGFYKAKRAFFTVNGTEHSLYISMKDFEEDRGSQLIEREAQKIGAILERTGSGTDKGK